VPLLVLLPLAVLTAGTALTAVMARRLSSSVRALDEAVGALGHLEASRAGLDDETSVARASMARLANS
jgi:ribulose kinase